MIDNRELYIVVFSEIDSYLIHCITDDEEIAESALKTLQVKAKKDYEKALKNWDFDFPMFEYKNSYEIEKANLNMFYRWHLGEGYVHRK